MRFVPVFLSLILAAPVYAQSGALPDFLGDGYFSAPDAAAPELQIYDDAFAAEHDFTLPAPFSITMPTRTGVDMEFLANPPGGALMAFIFTSEATETFASEYLEVLQFTTPPIPDMSDAEDPTLALTQHLETVMLTDFFPNTFGDFPEATIQSVGVIQIGDVSNAVELIGTYYDNRYDDHMLVRAVVMPHPDRPVGITAMSQVSLDVIPVDDAATLAATMGGRILSSFAFR